MARATLKDVAQRAGVTTATVSYALSGKRPISEETKLTGWVQKKKKEKKRKRRKNPGLC